MMSTLRHKILCLILLPLIGCADSERAPVEVETGGPLPDHESWTVVFDIVENGDKMVQIDAGYMGRYEEEDSTYTLILPDSLGQENHVTAKLYAEDASLSVLTAHRIVYFDDEERFDARGDVRVESSGGRLLTTEFLRWTTDRRIHAPGYVEIDSETEQLRGYDLRAADDLSEYVLLRPRGTAVIDNDGS